MNPYYDVPSGWKWVRLGDLCSRVNYGINEEASEDGSGQVFLRISDINDNGQLNSAKRKFLAKRISADEQDFLLPGDITIARSGSIGRSFLVSESERGWAFASYLIRFRPIPNLVEPEFLSRILISSLFRGYVDRVGRCVAQPNINSKELCRFLIPLPALIEQRRIVDVLRQAEALVARKNTRSGQLDLMIKAYLDRLVLGVDESEWVRLGTLVETRYGTSVSADEEIGSGTPVLRIPNVMGGEVDTTDMKYVGLSSAELDRLLLTKADVLIVRSNGNPDYVGRSAPITEDIVKAGMVYASYLIRLRANTEQLLPEYLSSFLNSAFGRAAMRNTIRTTAGQSNLSGENLTKIRIPLPSISEQKRFAAFWHEVRSLRQLISQSERIAKRLQAELTVFALSGELTEKWRDVHQKEIEAAITERDQILRERGAKLSIRTEVFAPPERPADFSRPTRYWLLNELSEFQGFVFDAMREWKGTLLADNASDLDEFYRLWPIEHERNMHDRAKRALEQLAALGLIAKVTLPNDNGDFVTGYRQLRPEEKSRLNDIAVLQASIESASHDASTTS